MTEVTDDRGVLLRSTGGWPKVAWSPHYVHVTSSFLFSANPTSAAVSFFPPSGFFCTSELYFRIQTKFDFLLEFAEEKKTAFENETRAKCIVGFTIYIYTLRPKYTVVVSESAHLPTFELTNCIHVHLHTYNNR